jgi:hypothetical protein
MAFVLMLLLCCSGCAGTVPSPTLTHDGTAVHRAASTEIDKLKHCIVGCRKTLLVSSARPETKRPFTDYSSLSMHAAGLHAYSRSLGFVPCVPRCPPRCQAVWHGCCLQHLGPGAENSLRAHISVVPPQLAAVHSAQNNSFASLRCWCLLVSAVALGDPSTADTTR